MTARDLCKLFGVSQSNGAAKSSAIRKVLRIIQLDPRWCLIEKAYEDELIEPFFICREDFEDGLKRGEDAALKDVRHDMGCRMPDDVHKHMSWWACLNERNRWERLDTRATRKPDRSPRFGDWPRLT